MATAVGRFHAAREMMKRSCQQRGTPEEGDECPRVSLAVLPTITRRKPRAKTATAPANRSNPMSVRRVRWAAPPLHFTVPTAR